MVHVQSRYCPGQNEEQQRPVPYLGGRRQRVGYQQHTQHLGRHSTKRYTMAGIPSTETGGIMGPVLARRGITDHL